MLVTGGRRCGGLEDSPQSWTGVGQNTGYTQMAHFSLIHFGCYSSNDGKLQSERVADNGYLISEITEQSLTAWQGGERRSLTPT